MIPHRNPWSWLWFLPTVALFIAGLMIGFSSHQITQRVLVPHSTSPDTYVQDTAGTTYQVEQGQQSGNVYIHAEGSNEYYVALSSDFTVSQSNLDTFHSIIFTARRDTILLDPKLNTGNSIITEAHKIEKLVFKDSSNKVIGTYTTAEYTSYLASLNPVYTTTTSLLNEWPLGFGLIIAGLFWSVCTTLVFFLRKQAKKRAMPISSPYQTRPFSAIFAKQPRACAASPTASARLHRFLC